MARRAMLVLAAVLATGAFAMVASADEGRVRIVNLAPGAAGGWVAPSAADQMGEVCGLTAEQAKKIRELEAARDKGLQEVNAQNAEKVQAAKRAMMEAYNSQDKEAIAKASADYQAAYAPANELRKQAQADIMNVLTAEQKATWQEHRAMAPIKRQYGAVLTDKQWAEIKDAYVELRKHPKAGERDIQRRLHAKVQGILTDDQKAALREQQVMVYIKSAFARAELTEEQMAKIKAAYADLAKDEKARPWTLMRKLSAQVREMLTDEQKKAMGASPQLRTLQKLGAPADAPQNPAKARTEEEPKAQVINVWGGAGGSVIVIDEAKEGAKGE